MKDLRDPKDLTIHDAKPISQKAVFSGFYLTIFDCPPAALDRLTRPGLVNCFAGLSFLARRRLIDGQKSGIPKSRIMGCRLKKSFS